MSDYTIDWSHTNIDGNNALTGASGNVGFTVSTPENTDHDQWMKGTVNGTDGLKAWDVEEPTKVEVSFHEEVTNIKFDLIDVDSCNGQWDDRVTVIAKDAHGNIVPVTFTGTNATQFANGNQLDATSGAVGAGDAGDKVTVHIAGPIVSLEIILDNGSGAHITGTVGLGDISFDAFEGDQDGYVDGTAGDDVIDVAYVGDPDGDQIDSGDALLPGEAAQDDVVLAGAGNDLVLAGDGDDEVYGGEGDDTLCGQDGDDVLYGGAGNDILEGMNNDDVLLGEAGNDTLYGDAGNDVMSGGTGDDKVFGGSGDDVASGGKGNDTINTGSGNDVAFGGAGADNIVGGAGNDTLTGGNMSFNGTQDFNDLEAGELVDGQYIAEGVTITSADPTNPVMAFDTANPTGGDTDLATNNLGKVLILSEDRDGSDPDDNGSGGTFHINFEAPADVTSLTLLDADGGAWVKYFDMDGNLLQQVDVTTADNGQHVVNTNLHGVCKIEVILGNSGAIDNLTYSINPNSADGNDVIDGGAGDDIIEGNAGDDTLEGGAGNDTISGGDDADLIIGGAGDVVDGGAGGNDYDVLDLTGQGPFFLSDVVSDTATGGNGNGFNGVVNFVDADGNPTGETLTFTDIEEILGDEINRGPDANTDAATTDEDTPVVINVLGNDTDPDGDTLTVTEATSPDGDVTINPDGTITFTPNDNFNGDATITYTIEDGNGGTDTATVNVTVAPVNDDPIVCPDLYFVTEDEGQGDVDGNVITNPSDNNAGLDIDPDGDPLTVVAVNGNGGGVGSEVVGSNGGLFTLNEDGSFDFSANGEFEALAPGETADTVITYTVSDGNGGTGTATLTITVQGIDDAPDAANDVANTDEDTPVVIDVLGNDTDPEGGELTVTEATSPDGDVTINADGTITFTPNPDFNGDATITYTVTDPAGNEDTATVNVNVGAVNDGPTATDNDYVVGQDDPADDTDGNALSEDTGNGSDSDPDGDDIRVISISNGTDTDTNDDPFGNLGSPATVTGDNGGIFTINNGGNILFDPNGDFDSLQNGETATTSVTYTISDTNGGTDTATVTFTVEGANDGPVANDDSDTTDEDTEVTVDLLGNDTDVDGDDLTVTEANLVSGDGEIIDNGDGTVTFVPAPNFNGEAVIEYTISDGNGGTDSAVHTITVDGVDDAPVAEDDAATADEDTPVTINVLGNDSDPDGDTLTVTEATSPDGDVTINPDGTITFTPNPDFTGDATINYTVTDPDGNEASAAVNVTVNPVNDAPDAVDDADVTAFNTPVTVDLLDNDTDVDGDDLSVISAQVPASQGTLLDNGDGTVTFTPVAGFTGVATITYVIEDEEGLTDTAIHTITVADGILDGTVEGTDGDDIIDGGYTGDPDGDMVDNDDAILPGDEGDDDLIFGFDGDDTIRAGAGDDEVFGGTGDDSIAGQGGNDTLSGDEGDDIITGGQDNDTIFGGDDNDILDGDSGDDSIEGGDGDDTILGGGGEDVIGGGDGDDVIDGENNDDTISGGAGNDDIDGGTGDDSISGGSGDDTIVGGAGEDDILAGSGDDIIDGGDDDDTIVAGDGSDSVEGGDGDDIIDTSGHAPLPDLSFGDIIPADGGTFVLPDGTVVVTSPDDDLDTVFGGAGNDTITTGDDADFIDGGTGDDVIDGGIDADEIIGGDGNDTIIGGEGSDSISGGDGDDTIFAGIEPGQPVLPGIPGGGFIEEQIDDDLGDPEPDNGDDLVFGGAGNDTIFGADDSDVLYGDEGDDVINGEIDDDTLFGGDGNDTLDGGANDDTIEGGAGDDVIIGGTGVDDLDGGLGSDTFLGGNGGDVVVGGEDPDGSDVDVLDLTGSNVDFITYDETDPTFANGVGESGTVTFQDGSTMTFAEIENVVPCFTPGTTIATPKGERLVEELREGDRIITRDNGIQEIRWVGRKEMTGKALMANPHLKPILVRAGSLGNGLPERDMLVSPNHRMLVASEKTQLYFEEREVLAAAKHLIGSEGIHAVDVMGTAYIHFMFDRHEVVLSNGAWTESFQPGDYSLKGIGNSQRNEIFELFPELQSKTGLEGYQSARRALKKHEARLLVK